jgi:hypothetical protein
LKLAAGYWRGIIDVMYYELSEYMYRGAKNVEKTICPDVVPVL